MNDKTPGVKNGGKKKENKIKKLINKTNQNMKDENID